MSRPRKITDEQVRETAGMTASEAARLLEVHERAVRKRRASLGLLTSLYKRGSSAAPMLKPEAKSKYAARASLSLRDGVVLIGSDCHYWPGDPSTAHRAFMELCRDMAPAAVVLNGDVVDGASVSRFPDIGWEKKPALVDEIAVAQERLRELQSVTPSARHIWTLGNHDMRFEMRLAASAKEYAGINGVHLRDHFPSWEPAWSVWINDGTAVVKHRFKGGEHAGYNNAVKAGTTMVTGHSHQLSVTPFSDYGGIRWGVVTGTLAVPYGDQFVNYTEDNPVNWASGFAVLTFVDGKLLWPELVHVVDEDRGLVSFRGKLLEV